jgi:DNA/RNA endonuclease YhcR with UshA esterase domain
MPAPRRVYAVLSLVLVISASAAAALCPGLTAAAEWPSSTGLLLAEVVTGGLSASDEYVEIANAGPVTADLGGCELIYVTASGATTTRKALFSTPLLLEPGQHLLVANAAGIYGPMADATYSGGLAADGGALALRSVAGSVIDAVGWGTAANQYVEGNVAPAPPAKSSLERRPGGPEGNTVDTNDNSSDWFLQPNPIPQSLASTPTSVATATPTMSVVATVTTAADSPSEAGTVGPTAPEPTMPRPTATAHPTAPERTLPEPTALPTPAPTASSVLLTPAPTASTSPSRAPSPSPSASEPDPISIAAARAQTPGALVHVIGVVTAAPGLTGAEGLFAVEGASGGVFVRWTGAVDGIVPGAEADVVGDVAAPYGQIEIRELHRLTVGPQGQGPAPVRAELSAIGEGTEARLVTVRGTVESVTTDSGRLTIVVGDDSASVRAMADPLTGLTRDDVAHGDVVLVTGVVGQRASASGLADGYRVWLRGRSDLLLRPEIDPPQPDPPQSGPPQQEPLPTSTGAAVLHDLSSLVGRRGSAVDANATVTAAAGLLDINGPTIVVEDGTGAVAVVLPAGADAPGVGMRVHITGKVGSWEGGPTILATRVESQGELQAVEPDQLSGALGSLTEWRLVRVCGRIQRVTHAGSRWRVEVLINDQLVVVLGEPAAGISIPSSSVGRLAMVTGIVRRSTSNSAEFQLLPRSPLDLRLGPAGAASAVSTTSGGNVAGLSVVATASGGPAGGVIGIGSLADYLGLDVTVVGLVMATGVGEVTIVDDTGEVRIGGPSAAEALSLLEPGDAVEVRGRVTQDERGLLIQADAASIVILPGGEAAASRSPGSVVGLLAGNEAASILPGPRSASSIRQVSATVPLPDVLTLLGTVALLLVGVAVCLAARRRRNPLAARPSILARRPRLGLLPRLVRAARLPRVR